MTTCLACRIYDWPDCWHSPEYEPIARSFAVAVHGAEVTDEVVAGFIDDAERIGSDVWRLIGRRDSYVAESLGFMPTNPDRFSLLLDGRLVVTVDGSNDGSGESFAAIAADLGESRPRMAVESPPTETCDNCGGTFPADDMASLGGDRYTPGDAPTAVPAVCKSCQREHERAWA